MFVLRCLRWEDTELDNEQSLLSLTSLIHICLPSPVAARCTLVSSAAAEDRPVPTAPPRFLQSQYLHLHPLQPVILQ